MNNSGVKRYFIVFSFLREDKEETIKNPLTQENLLEIKNLLIKTLLSIKPETPIEKAKEIIDSCFISDKIYSTKVKHFQDEDGKKYSIIDILTTGSNNRIINLATLNGGYTYRGQGGRTTITMANFNYLYLKVAYLGRTNSYNDSSSLIYNRERSNEIGVTNFANQIDKIYDKINPSCASFLIEEFIDKKTGYIINKVNVKLAGTVEEGFAANVTDEVQNRIGLLRNRIYYVCKPSYGFITLKNKKMKASILNGKLILRDSDDILQEQYTNHLKNITEMYNTPFIIFFEKFANYNARNTTFICFSDNFNRMVIESVPKEFILQSKNIMSCSPSENGFAKYEKSYMLYDLLIKDKNNYPYWLGNRISLRNKPTELVVPFDKTTDNLLFVLDFYTKLIKVMRDAQIVGDGSLFPDNNLLQDLYNDSEYITQIKSFNGGKDIIDTWFRQCCEQSEKNKEKLIENFSAMKNKLIKEKIETNIYLRHHDYSKCLPIPSLAVKNFALNKIKNSTTFMMQKTLYTRLCKIDVTAFEEYRLFLRMLVDTAFFNRKYNIKGEIILETDIMDFYNSKENAIVISQDKVKEVCNK